MKIPVFTEEELHFLNDYHLFDLRIEINRKIISLFSTIEANLKEIVNSSSYQFPEGTFKKSGKISKGENYKNHPYFVLDYPRLFSREDIFSVRTIFWWGHYFGNSFLISGKSLQRERNTILRNIQLIRNSEGYICINKSPWLLENDPHNYRKISELSENHLHDIISNHPFIKLSSFYKISDYERILPASKEFLQLILDLLY